MDIWDTSCPDWESRILSGRSLVPDLPLFAEERDRALRVFKRMKVPDVFGNPTLGEICPEWFLSIVAALFGSYDRSTRFRYIQEVFLLIPKGNSKSSYGAPLMLTGLVLNDLPAVEMDLISTTKSIADRIFDQIKNTIKLDDELTKAFHVKDGQRTIIRRLNDAELVVKAADTDVITGGKQVATFVDETHEFADRANAAKVFTEIRGALGKRKNGFLIQATTQSKKEPVGQFKAELENARAVRDGKRRDRLLPILYELPAEIVKREEWKERKYWGLVNPNLGKSISEDFIERGLIKAEEEGLDKLQLFASQHFNVEIGLALASDAWAGSAFWLSNADVAVKSFETIINECEVVTIGIDGGGLDDLLGLCVMGRKSGSRRWMVYAKAWCHPKVLENRKQIASKLLDLEKTKDLVISADVNEHVRQAVEIVCMFRDAGLLPEKGAIGVDLIGIPDIVDELSRQEVDVTAEAGHVVGIPQGYQLTNVIKTAERRLSVGDMRHGGQELMNWCVGNAKTEPRGNAILITKQKSGTAKIDPLMALFNAAALMVRNPEAQGGVGVA